MSASNIRNGMESILVGIFYGVYFPGHFEILPWFFVPQNADDTSKQLVLSEKIVKLRLFDTIEVFTNNFFKIN
jgi:hypothetical protein